MSAGAMIFFSCMAIVVVMLVIVFIVTRDSRHYINRIHETTAIQADSISEISEATKSIASYSKQAHTYNEKWLDELKADMKQVVADMQYMRGHMNNKMESSK